MSNVTKIWLCPSNFGSPRLVETPFCSPQLLLFDLGPDEWLLYWKAPDDAARRRRPSASHVTQLALFDVPQEKAMGAETTSPFLRLMRVPPEHQDV